jgi:hypothetical protein
MIFVTFFQDFLTDDLIPMVFLTFHPLRASCETQEDFENLDSGIHPEVSRE